MSASSQLTQLKSRSHETGTLLTHLANKGVDDELFRETLPRGLQPALLALLLLTLSDTVSPSTPRSYQPANSVVVRKLFGSVLPLRQLVLWAC